MAIHLIEASFSEGSNKILSKRVIMNVRLKSIIPEDQYARKGGRSVQAVLQNVLCYDYSRIMRLTGAIVANDMHSCYNRMVHCLTSLALWYLGAPTPAVECMWGTAQLMRHYIRMAFGDSRIYYRGDSKKSYRVEVREIHSLNNNLSTHSKFIRSRIESPHPSHFLQ